MVRPTPTRFPINILCIGEGNTLLHFIQCVMSVVVQLAEIAWVSELSGLQLIITIIGNKGGVDYG